MSSVQTMAGWPRLINSRDEIPLFFTRYLGDEVLASPDFPYMVYIPPTGNRFMRYNPMVAYLLGNNLCILEKIGKQANHLVFPFEDINFIEKGTILLNTWLKISGVIHGKLVHKQLEFNTVANLYMDHMIDTVRSSNIKPSVYQQKNEQAEKFDFLCKVNYKFMSYGRESLMPESKVIQMMMQEEVKEERLRILGKSFFKIKTPMHLSILTEDEYILLKDTYDGLSRYGIIFTYIPLRRIENELQQPTAEGDAFHLCLNLRNQDQIQLLYQSKSDSEVKAFLDALKMNRLVC